MRGPPNPIPKCKPRPKIKSRRLNGMKLVNKKTKARLEKEVIHASIRWHDSLEAFIRYPNSEICASRQVSSSYILEDSVKDLKEFNQHITI